MVIAQPNNLNVSCKLHPYTFQRTRYTQLMRPNKVETAVQCFRMSCVLCSAYFLVMVIHFTNSTQFIIDAATYLSQKQNHVKWYSQLYDGKIYFLTNRNKPPIGAVSTAPKFWSSLVTKPVTNSLILLKEKKNINFFLDQRYQDFQ